MTIDPETDILDGCLAPHRCHDGALRIECYLNEFGLVVVASDSGGPSDG